MHVPTHVIYNYACFVDIDDVARLAMVNKEYREVFTDQLYSRCYQDWYRFFPEIVENFEKKTKKTFYHVMDMVKIAKLFNILMMIEMVYYRKKKEPYRQLLRPLLTGELFIKKSKHVYTLFQIIREFVNGWFSEPILHTSMCLTDWFDQLLVSYCAFAGKKTCSVTKLVLGCYEGFIQVGQTLDFRFVIRTKSRIGHRDRGLFHRNIVRYLQ